MKATGGKISDTQFKAMAELTNHDGTMTIPSPLTMYRKATVRRLVERGLVEVHSVEPTTWAAAVQGRRRFYVLTAAGRIALHEHRHPPEQEGPDHTCSICGIELEPWESIRCVACHSIEF